MPVLERYGTAGWAESLSRLLPRGDAWTVDPNSVFDRFITGLAAVWADAELRIAALLERESDPRLTLEMLEDWERMLGLPDECFLAGDTIEERRLRVVAKLTSKGGQSRAYFIGIARALGYDITIREFSPLMCGVGHVGFTGSDLSPPSMRYTWVIEISGARERYFRMAGSQAGVDRLYDFDRADDLECYLQRLKPSHTTLIFDYQGV